MQVREIGTWSVSLLTGVGFITFRYIENIATEKMVNKSHVNTLWHVKVPDEISVTLLLFMHWCAWVHNTLSHIAKGLSSSIFKCVDF